MASPRRRVRASDPLGRINQSRPADPTVSSAQRPYPTTRRSLDRSLISVTFDVYGRLFDADGRAERSEDTFQTSFTAFPRLSDLNTVIELPTRNAEDAY